jgi:hypothetical protein
MPRFSLSTILFATAVTGLALLSVVRPWAAWLLVWPFLISGLCIVLFVRAAPIQPKIAFWSSVAVGTVLCLTLLAIAELISAIASDNRPEPLHSFHIWFWVLLGHTEPLANPKRPVEFASFVLSLHVIFAAVWSAAVTVAAQLVFTRSDRR